MPSQSLRKWTSERSEALDEIEGAHAAVGGSERGRRYATQQINYAYATLLASQFQGFCRELHTECVEVIVAGLPPAFRATISAEFFRGRNLDRGNPHPGALGSDFARLGVDLWPRVYVLDARNARRRELLQELMDWRNAIAHQDFESVAADGDTTLHLARVRDWRRALNALARDFDRVVYNSLVALTGSAPW